MKRSSSTSSSDRRALGRLALFLALLIGLTVAGYLTMNALHGREQQAWRVQDDMVTDFFAQEENSLNALFIGSSRMMCSLIPSRAEAAAPGLQCFNLGASSQMPDTTYHLLKAALDRQESVELVVMDLFYGFMQKEHDMTQSALIFRPMPPCRQKVAMFFDLFDAKERESLLKTWFNPFLRAKNAALYNLQLSLGLTQEARDTSGTYMGDGFYSLGERVAGYADLEPYVHAPETFAGLTSTQCAYVERIAELCEERGMTLVFVAAPMWEDYLPLNPVLDRASEELTELCEGLEVPFYNMMDRAAELGLDGSCFADRYHFNQTGAERYTELLVGLLKTDGYLK